MFLNNFPLKIHFSIRFNATDLVVALNPFGKPFYPVYPPEVEILAPVHCSESSEGAFETP